MQGRDVLFLLRGREAGVPGQLDWDLFSELGGGGCGDEDWSLSYGKVSYEAERHQPRN